MAGFLAQASAEAAQRVAAAARAESLDALRTRAEALPAPPGFAAALRRPGVGVIAEVKRASPSRGDLAPIPDAVALADAYATGGAAAVSVLTEPRHFKGSLGDLAAIADAVTVPALRKDFVVDPYQVWEARAAGASAVLLIVAALAQSQLTNLLEVAADAGLDALVEVHDMAEVELAGLAHAANHRAPPLVIGINARNLSTLAVDRSQFSVVRRAVPPRALAVAESGVQGPQDVRRLADEGADAVLVGEHVATAADPAAAVRALTAAGALQQQRTLR